MPFEADFWAFSPQLFDREVRLAYFEIGGPKMTRLINLVIFGPPISK
jgi:hypothetical protein